MLFELILNSLWFILPAYVANAVPVAIGKIKILQKHNVPLDFNVKILSKPIFGPGKTWLGFIFGVFFGTFIGILQGRLITLVIMLSTGALIGDTAASFLKRRFGISRGKPVPLLDQLDFVVGAFIFAALVIPINIYALITILIITPFIHLTGNMIGYKIGIKNQWW